MRKIIKFLSSLLIFLFEIFLVIVFIVEVAVSSLIMQTIDLGLILRCGAT